ncbi:cupin domain-containing protein [Spiribacter curvatus]|uniref:cupin domain-containing protein n=1 Tax=Spiribacter curvatus TaxID=1335757 RepID=UPI001F29BC8F|nr:cupin domain-containing protein [Spiribacter curvatus]
MDTRTIHQSICLTVGHSIKEIALYINADLKQRAAVRFNASDWVASPMPGVERRMLDRVGEEVARATSIVRFAPGSAFSAHAHDGGEEYIVLDGTFQDEDGDFPTGCYVRNPPTTSHTPAATDGATILVKLHQFDPEDRTSVRLDTNQATWDQPAIGVERLLLHEDPREQVVMESWAPGTRRHLDATGGLEVFLLSGELSDGTDSIEAWDWLRLPPGSVFEAEAGPDGARLWFKSGHLSHVADGPA